MNIPLKNCIDGHLYQVESPKFEFGLFIEEEEKFISLDDDNLINDYHLESKKVDNEGVVPLVDTGIDIPFSGDVDEESMKAFLKAALPTARQFYRG